jgi:glycosyltransferase involved in cell wall biosynthesis
MNKKALIVYRYTPEYRIRFYELLKKELASNSIDLDIIYGQDMEAQKKDYVALDWAKYKKNTVFKMGKYAFIWQPAFREVNNADLVIVEQANKLLINYYLLLRRLLPGKKKFAFWGHGLNLQDKKSSLFNKFKKIYTNHCDWWFAYTAGIKNFLVKNGYPENKITIVQNAIDTRKNIEWFNTIDDNEVRSLKLKYQIGQNDMVGIYCGSLYKEKRIEFLLEAADQIRSKNPSFKLLIVGGGPDEYLVKDALLTRPWLVWAGTQFGRNKALHFKLADFFMLPGLVGLAILDSFSFNCPVVTTEYEYHSPEIEYLENGENGIITKNNLNSYINAVDQLINNREKLNYLKKNCKESALNYTVENMVKNFAAGIANALN